MYTSPRPSDSAPQFLRLPHRICFSPLRLPVYSIAEAAPPINAEASHFAAYTQKLNPASSPQISAHFPAFSPARPLATLADSFFDRLLFCRAALHIYVQFLRRLS